MFILQHRDFTCTCVSLSAALHFLSLWKIVYFENIYFIFLCQKTFLPV